jgi:hypothetical protein
MSNKLDAVALDQLFRTAVQMLRGELRDTANSGKTAGKWCAFPESHPLRHRRNGSIAVGKCAG